MVENIQEEDVVLFKDINEVYHDGLVAACVNGLDYIKIKADKGDNNYSNVYWVPSKRICYVYNTRLKELREEYTKTKLFEETFVEYCIRMYLWDMYIEEDVSKKKFMDWLLEKFLIEV